LLSLLKSINSKLSPTKVALLKPKGVLMVILLEVILGEVTAPVFKAITSRVVKRLLEKVTLQHLKLSIL